MPISNISNINLQYQIFPNRQTWQLFRFFYYPTYYWLFANWQLTTSTLSLQLTSIHIHCNVRNLERMMEGCSINNLFEVALIIREVSGNLSVSSKQEFIQLYSKDATVHRSFAYARWCNRNDLHIYIYIYIYIRISWLQQIDGKQDCNSESDITIRLNLDYLHTDSFRQPSRSPEENKFWTSEAWTAIAWI